MTNRAGVDGPLLVADAFVAHVPLSVLGLGVRRHRAAAMAAEQQPTYRCAVLRLPAGMPPWGIAPKALLDTLPQLQVEDAFLLAFDHFVLVGQLPDVDGVVEKPDDRGHAPVVAPLGLDARLDKLLGHGNGRLWLSR